MTIYELSRSFISFNFRSSSHVYGTQCLASIGVRRTKANTCRCLGQALNKNFITL
ncbi:hypothetical protein LEP1GSC170_4914 [Leptospira interrogans serovar Bataviae str. HAI135]|nr:hypothetical protein LEP1GSC170_4914 [Leptospira interrogans serovar Bataviae str. HAI135]